MARNKNAYPITRGLETEVNNLLDKLEPRKFSMREICDILTEVVGEYEHGSADVEDCEGVSLEQYKAVVFDAILSLAYF